MPEIEKEKIPLPKLMEAVLPYQAGIYVTVLNIIQCIALAFLINEVRGLAIRNEWGLYSMLRSALALVIILVVWYRYVAESQYLWPMSWLDTLIPFFIGITESAIVFCIDAEKVPLQIFIGSILFLQLLTMLAYGYAYLKRSLKITERLYEEFYKGFPKFAGYIVIFLKIYSWHSMKMMGYFLAQTAVFLVLVLVFPLEMFEMFFSMLCILTIVLGESLRGFHQFLWTDPVLGPYLPKEVNNEERRKKTDLLHSTRGDCVGVPNVLQYTGEQRTSHRQWHGSHHWRILASDRRVNSAPPGKNRGAKIVL